MTILRRWREPDHLIVERKEAEDDLGGEVLLSIVGDPPPVTLIAYEILREPYAHIFLHENGYLRLERIEFHRAWCYVRGRWLFRLHRLGIRLFRVKLRIQYALRLGPFRKVAR